MEDCEGSREFEMAFHDVFTRKTKIYELLSVSVSNSLSHSSVEMLSFFLEHKMYF